MTPFNSRIIPVTKTSLEGHGDGFRALFCSSSAPNIEIDAVADESDGPVPEQSIDAAGVEASRREVSAVETYRTNAIPKRSIRSHGMSIKRGIHSPAIVLL